LLYCDTDSAFAAFPEGSDVEDRILGKHLFFDTKKRDTVIKDAVFVLPKTYGLVLRDGSEVLKVKGVGVGGLSFSELKDSFYSRRPLVVPELGAISKYKLDYHYSSVKREILIDKYDKRS
jgi:hypothetical protein